MPRKSAADMVSIDVPEGHVLVRRQVCPVYLPLERVVVGVGDLWHLPEDEARQHDATNRHWVMVAGEAGTPARQDGEHKQADTPAATEVE